MSKLKIGLIGVGRIGQIHAENLALRIPGADLVAVTDANARAAAEIADRLEIPHVPADYRALAASGEVDAIVICSPTDTHAEIIQHAAALGKHIFCEKPIDLSLTSTNQALSAATEAGVQLQIGFNRRFDPEFAAAQQQIHAGNIGRPHVLRITSRDPQPPPLDYVQHSGGLFLDMAIHDFDMARFLIGSEVTHVFAAGGVLIDESFHQANDIDTAVTTLTFENGALGIVDNSRRAVYGYDQRVEVLGATGMLAVGNRQQNRCQIASTDGFTSAPLLDFFMTRYLESYLEEMQQFVSCVAAGTSVPVQGEDARHAMVIALAARKSYAERRQVAVAEVSSDDDVLQVSDATK